MYFDVNNLYGWAMSQHMPLSGYKWINKFSIEDILNTPDDSMCGYILEVDLKYSQHLHDLHQQYPMCAEHRIPPKSKLNNKKLLLTLYDKKKYVIHYSMLKYVLQQGLILKKVHRVLQFTQAPWLKEYIDLNTVNRTKADNEFEKDLFKLMSNAIYGKAMEDKRGHGVHRLVTKWDGLNGAKSLIVNPRFKNSIIFSENLMAIELNKSSILLNKPIAVGFTVLEISKLLMYRFHYDFMLKTFGSNCQLNYTDTDSFIYTLSCNDVYKDFIKPNKIVFDTSNYEPNNKYDIQLHNKKIPGLMKDENGGHIMTEFVGLRSKMYSTRVRGFDSVKKAKGVKKYVLKENIKFSDYLDCIKNNCIITGRQNRIHNRKHKVFSISQKKILLSPFDDKLKILDNGINTLPWGHYKIK